MFFKRTAILFLFLAAAILLLHNVVPHSHHHLEHSIVGHHSHEHHHNANLAGESHHHHNSSVPEEEPLDDGNDLADILSFINHHSESITFLVSTKLTNTLAKQSFFPFFIIPGTFFLDDFIFPPILQYQAAFFENNLFFTCTHTLRGPPSIAI